MKIRNLTDIKTLFFDNKTIKQTIFKNTFWLGLSSVISRLLTFFLFIYVARVLGPTQYGEFTFALSFILLFSIFPNFGLSKVAIRELSQGEEGEKDYPSLLSLKLLLTLGTLVAVIIGAFFITDDPAIQKVIWILASYVMIGSFAQVIYIFLEARQKMEYEALAKILEVILYVGFGFFVIFNFPSVENLAYGHLASIVVFLILFLTSFHLKIYKLYFKWDVSIWKKYLKMSWPLAFAAFFATVYNQIDSVMMGSWGQITQTGWYNAADRIVTVTIIPASIIATSFFPALSKAFKETKEKFQEIWNHQMEIMLYFSFPVIIGGIVLAPKIIDYFFGSGFGPSVLVLQILIMMSGILFLYTIFNWALIIADQQKKIFLVGMFGMLLNIILNLILIPKYSLYGAAAATVFTNFLIVILFFICTAKFTPIKTINQDFLRNLFGAILCSSVMYFVISRPVVYNFHVLYCITIGAGVYLACFLGYKKRIIKLISK